MVLGWCFEVVIDGESDVRIMAGRSLQHALERHGFKADTKCKYRVVTCAKKI